VAPWYLVILFAGVEAIPMASPEDCQRAIVAIRQGTARKLDAICIPSGSGMTRDSTLPRLRVLPEGFPQGLKLTY
jgi:hypothetical protein